MMNLAYAEGRSKAEEDFGLRLAADSLHRSLPQGDMNVSAERLAKVLTELDPGVRPPKGEETKRLERPVRWGESSSPYGANASSFDYSGIGRDGAAA